MARYGATIAAVFPMESEVYTWAGAETCYVGHPLLDMVRVEEEVSEIYQYLEFDPGKPVIGLLPGSRRAEIDRLLPEMLQAAEKLQGEDHHLQFVIPVAPGFSGPEISRMASNYRVIIKAVNDYTYQVMKVSDLLVTASGTATLEAAIFKTPMIIVYKTSNLTYRLVKRLVKVDFISLPNIIAGREIVPELIQDEAKSENIYRRCKDLIYKPYLTVNTRKNLETVKDKLGKEGAVNRTARLVLKKGAIDYLDGK